MLIIESNKISITRGDDAVLEVQPITSNGFIYQMHELDTLTLSVCKRPDIGAHALLQVSSIPGSNRIVIRSEDTVNIEPGTYSADIQLTTWDNKRFTVWPQLNPQTRTSTYNWKNFIIMPEVTHL